MYERVVKPRIRHEKVFSNIFRCPFDINIAEIRSLVVPDGNGQCECKAASFSLLTGSLNGSPVLGKHFVAHNKSQTGPTMVRSSKLRLRKVEIKQGIQLFFTHSDP